MKNTNRDYRAVRALMDESHILRKPGMDALKAVYEHATVDHAKQTASIYFDEDGKRRKMSYRDYARKTVYLARHLSTLLSGLPEGPVAIKMRNSENWPLLFWAVAMNGREILLVDSRLKKENAENLLRQAGARAILANEVDPYSIPTYRLNDIRNAHENPAFEPRFSDKVIFASSGTTGDAKLIEMSAHNLTSQILAADNLPERNLLILNNGTTNNLAMIPFHHIFGFVAVFLWYTFFGLAIVYPSSTSIRDVVAAIKNAPCTHVYSVPMFWDGVAQTLERTIALKVGKVKELFEKMIAYNNGEITKKEAGFAGTCFFRRLIQKKAFGTQIVYCISGGGAIGKKTMRIINGLGYPLSNGYGMTEIGVACVETRADPQKRLLGSIGSLFSGFEAKIRDGKQEGELLIKSPTIHESEIVGGKRVPTHLEDGYFATGDIATIDGDGYLFLKGRIKDTIIDTNGENVYPDEIEDYFRNLPHAKNIACFGLEIEGREQICLAIETDNASEENAVERIREAFKSINEGLPEEKKVDLPYIYRRSLPISGSMKVKRFQLRDELSAGSKDFIPLFGRTESSSSSEERFATFDPAAVKEARARVRKVFSKNLHLLEEKIGYDDVWDRDLGGDSMSYVAMVSDINDEFRVEIPVDLYGKIGTVDDFAYEVLTLAGKRKAK